MTIGQDLSDYMEGQFTEEEDKQIRNLTVEEVFKLLSTHLTKEYPEEIGTCDTCVKKLPIANGENFQQSTKNEDEWECHDCVGVKNDN